MSDSLWQSRFQGNKVEKTSFSAFSAFLELTTLDDYSKLEVYDLSDSMKTLLVEMFSSCPDRFTNKGLGGLADFFYTIRNRIVNKYLQYSRESSAVEAVKPLADQLETLLTANGFVRIQGKFLPEYKVTENFDKGSINNKNLMRIIQQMDELDEQFLEQLLSR